MGQRRSEEFRSIKRTIVDLYNVLYVDQITTEDIEFYELTDETEEAEVYLPEIGVNISLWRDWSTEKRIEVLIHEFAHTEDYDDDHLPTFWDRVVELTEIALDHQQEIEAVFDQSIDPTALKQAIVDSVHEEVIETDVDTVGARRRALRQALGVEPDA